MTSESTISDHEIPVFDYRRGLAEERELIFEAIGRVLDSGQLILGPEVEAFESELASSLGAAHAVGVGNGTDAIALALRALGIGNGDEVVTVANTAVPTVAALRSVGAIPRFVDVDDETLLMDPGRLEAAVSDETRAIVPVHLFGSPANMPEILAVAERHGLAVVEDCAQAHGSEIDGRSVGTFGRVGCFSFYPTKNLGAFGDAGACVTDDPALAERIRMHRMYGFRQDGHARIEGVNSRMDELHAAVLRVRLRSLERRLDARERVAGWYDARLGDLRTVPALRAGWRHTHHLFVVRVPHRERVIEALAAEGIGTGVHYPEPIHLMEAYAQLGYGRGDLPVTERAATEVLSLPIFPELTEAEVERVVNSLRSALGRSGAA